jgi:hypothetical protein
LWFNYFDHSSQTVTLVAQETVPLSSRAEHHENTAVVCQAAGGAKPPESVLDSIFPKMTGVIWSATNGII